MFFGITSELRANRIRTWIHGVLGGSVGLRKLISPVSHIVTPVVISMLKDSQQFTE